ncbi:hypothetical protein MKQ68_23870 [Chitinophaga horti]|uniref:DUF748 domain-containing protein n=1 Tax=Chitinophaga horti TaxID=2920382 RepID=A0ABY6J0C9_9BACT|nr:hypothetical protein [Chitinophaga horti]UYQ93123.1 hypothetical protein MKQ68_23870 [Chitinophaga horti]
MKKFLKVALITLGVLIVAVVIIGVYLNHHWKGILNKELKVYVQKSTDSLYHLEYSDIDMNLLTGYVNLQQAVLKPDSARYVQLQKEQRAPNAVFTLKVPALELRGVKILRYVRKHEIAIGSIKLNNPEVGLVQDDNSVDTTTKKGGKQLQGLSVGRAELLNVTFSMTRIRKDSVRVLTRFTEIDARVRDLVIDSLTQKDPERFFYAKQFDINLKKYDFRTPDSLYWLHVKNLQYQAASQQLAVEQVTLEPRYSKAEQDKIVGYQKDRFDIKFDSVNAAGVSPQHLMKGEIFIASLRMKSGKLDVYRNRTLPLPPGNKLGSFPNQMILKLKTPLRLDTLKPGTVDISYTELNPKTKKQGTVKFLNAGGTLTNITNVDSVIARKKSMVADLHTKVMQNGPLKARFEFMLDDTSGAFNVSGHMGAMDAREFTPVVRGLAMVEIKSCNVKSVDFNIQGNEMSAKGVVKFIYDDLKISVLEQDEDTKKVKKKGLKSMLANIIAIKPENPAKEEAPRVAYPSYKRDIRKSYFNLVWKTLSKGLMEIAATDAIQAL